MTPLMKKILLVLVLLVVAVGAYMYKADTLPVDLSFLGKDKLTATSTDDFGVKLPGVADNPLEGVSLDLIPQGELPAIVRPVVKPADLSNDAFVAIRSNIEQVADMLASDEYNYDLWVELGNYRNMVADYEGARIAWDFARQIRPTQATTYFNLGDLYQNHYKEYSRAEEYYLAAIDYAPEAAASYVRLFDLYRFFYKEKKAEAGDVLVRGLDQIPGNLELLVHLSRFYVGQEDYVNAQDYYKQAIESARNQGLDDVARDLEIERASVPKN